MSDLGHLLKKARTERNYSLDDLQDITKIRKRYLEAIEEGNYKILPGNFYVRAFIKSYSEAVGLDPDEVLRLYRNVIPSAGTERTAEPIRRKKRRSPSSEKFSKIASAILMWCFPLLIIGIIYYYISDHYQSKDAPDPGSITDEKKGGEPDVPGVSDGNNADPVTEEPPVEPPPAPSEPALTLIKSDGQFETYALANTDRLVVEMTVTGDRCWIETKKNSSDGEKLASKVFVKDDKLSWDVDHSLNIRIGAPMEATLKVNDIVIDMSQMKTPKTFQIDLMKLTLNDQIQ